MAKSSRLTLKHEHSDQRGEIYSIAMPDGTEILLQHSLAGAKRGGHHHDVDEVVVLLSGKMRYVKKAPNGQEYAELLSAGGFSYNPAGLIHMGEFLEDGWLIEYKLGKQKEQVDYEPYRVQVRASAGV